MLQQSVLYKLSLADKSPSYLFGTMHVRDAAAFSHLDAALEVLGNCSHFYAEMDLDEAAHKINPEDYLMPEGLSVQDLIKPARYKKISAILQKAYSLNMAEWHRFYPMIIVNRISESILSEDNALALDAFLWTHAKSVSKQMGGLETVDEQIGTMRMLDLDIQAGMLKSLCRDVNKFKRTVLNLASKYQDADIVALYKMSKKGLGQMKNPLLFDRNIRMAHRIMDSMMHPSLFAVGAAHLAGAKGILNILKQGGIKISAC